MRENIVASIIRFGSRLFCIDMQQEEQNKSSRTEVQNSSNSVEIPNLDVNYIFSHEKVAKIPKEGIFEITGYRLDFTLPNMDEQCPFKIGVPYGLHELIRLKNPSEEHDFDWLLKDSYFTIFWNNTNSGYYSFIRCIYEKLISKNGRVYDIFLTKIYQPKSSGPNYYLTNKIDKNLTWTARNTNITRTTPIENATASKCRMDILAIRLRIIIWGFYNRQKDDFLSCDDIEVRKYGLELDRCAKELFEPGDFSMGYFDLCMLSEIFSVEIHIIHLYDDLKNIIRHTIYPKKIENATVNTKICILRLANGYYIPVFRQ